MVTRTGGHMGRWADGQMDGDGPKAEKRAGGQIDRRKTGQMNKWTYGQVGTLTNGQREIDGRKDGRMDRFRD